MKTLKWTLIAAAVFNLTACAFDKNSSLDTKRELEDRATLTAKYEQIKGLYSGAVTTSTGTQTVELLLSIVEVGNGNDSNGKARTVPGMVARYRRTDVVMEDQILTVNYFPEVSPPQLIMTNIPASGTSNNQNAVSVIAYMSDDGFTGTVTTAAGPLGPINAHLINREASNPSQGDPNEQYERLSRMYAQVVGNYSGMVNPDPQQATKFRARLELFIGQEADASGNLMPTLVGIFRRSDDPTGDRELLVKADYRPDANPPRISIASTKPRKNPTSTDTVTVSGTIQNGMITGRLTDNYGRATNVVLKKENTSATMMKRKQ